MQKFLQKGWAAQGFKAKKRLKAEPAAAPQGSQPIKAKTLGYSSYKTPFLDTALQLGLGFWSALLGFYFLNDFLIFLVFLGF